MSVSTTAMPTTVGTVTPSAIDVTDAVAGTSPRSTTRRLRVGHRTVHVAVDGVAAALATAVCVLLVPELSWWALPVAAVAWTTIAAAAGAHRPGHTPYAGRARRVLRAATATAALAWGLAALSPGLLGDEPATAVRTALLACALVTVLSLLLGVAATRLARTAAAPVVLVGAPEGLEPALVELARDAVRWDPVAVCRPGDPESVLAAVRAHRARAVLAVPGPELAPDELRRLGAALHAEGADLLVTSGLHDVAASRLDHVTLGSLRAVHVRGARTGGPARLAKAVADRVLALGLLVALAPLLAAVTVLVRTDSPGPAIYRQVRVGRHGRLFTVYKFRSMRTDADDVRATLVSANESDRTGCCSRSARTPGSPGWAPRCASTPSTSSPSC